MFKFNGECCQYCKEKLIENDDIVVCPECGSPYHRECYAKSGACVRVDLHTNGETYKSENNVNTTENTVIVRCPRCGAENNEDNASCNNCGYILKTSASGSFAGFSFEKYKEDSSEEVEEGVTVGDVSAYLGQNSGYFISKYKRMKQSGIPLSFNFSALFFNYMYLIYRKRYALGIAIALILAVLNLPSLLVNISSIPELAALPQFGFLTTVLVEKLTKVSIYTEILTWIAEVSIGVFFNWFYMKGVIKKVKNMKQLYGSDFSGEAAKHGGVINGKTVLVLFAIYFGIVMISEFILLFFM